MKRVMIIASCLAAFVALTADAQIPKTLNYQGVLTDGGGVAVPDGEYYITFSIYNQESEGSALWTEVDTVQVTDGIFSVILGTVIPLDLAFDEPYWMGMAVEGEAELDPRVELTASAYSLNARGVTGEENVFPSAGYVGIGTTSPNEPLTIEGSPGQQVGLRYRGYDNSWSSIYVAAMQGFSKPGYGYVRAGLKAHTFVDTNDNWMLRVGSTDALSVMPSGNVGLGFINPVEKLEIDGAVKLGGAAGTYAGTIQWTGTDFEGYDGSTWKSLTATGGGSLPSGTTGQTLRHNGTDWAASSFLYNDGSHIGIGTTSPQTHLHINEDTDSGIGIRIENTNTGSLSSEYITFRDENGSVAGIRCYDDDSPGYTGQMAIYNNRPSGAINLRTGGVDRVLLNEAGQFGIGVSNPNATLHVAGGDGDVDVGEGDLKIGNSSYRLKIGVDTDPGDGDAGTTRIRAQGGTETLSLGGGSADVVVIEPNGDVSIGSDVQGGTLELFRTGVTGSIMRTYSNSHGGNFELSTETGDPTVLIQPDVDGEGGYLTVYRSLGASGFYVNGNMGGTNEPYVGISGSSQGVAFDMRMSGDSSVDLPADAIASAEIFDEAGCAGVNNYDLTAPDLTGGYDVLASRSITAPTAGYVLVTGTCQLTIDHTIGTMSSADVGVSAVNSSFATSCDMTVVIPSSAETGRFIIPVTSHALFTVAAGTHTYYLLAHEGSGDFVGYDVNLTAVFIPTAYGTVSPTLAGSSGGAESGSAPALTASELAAERAESIAFNESRIEREIAEMRARLAELERAVANK